MLNSPLHEHHLLRYQVEIEEKSWRNFSKVAHISFFDENNKKVVIEKYGVLSIEEIFLKIDRGEDLILNNAYILNFALTDYRTEKGYDDSFYVSLKNFSAKKAFFDCDISNDFSYAKFEGEKIVFDSSIFGNGSNLFSNAQFCNGDVSFKKTKFGSGSTTFQSVQFGDGLVSFNNTSFGTGNLSFVDCSFKNGNVDFKSTYFGDGHIDFKFAKFSGGDVFFERALFGNGKKDFKNVEFGGGKVDFRRVHFNDGDVSFEGVEFGNGKVSFRGARFGSGEKNFELSDFAQGDAQFDLTDFGSGSVSFGRAKVDKISFNGCALNCFMDLRFETCDTLDLGNTIVRDILDLKSGSDLVKITLFNISGMRILGRIFIDWKSNRVGELIYNQKETTLFQKAEQFRILKENFRNNGQYDDEDLAYIEFKRCESRAEFEEAKGKNGPQKAMGYMNYYFQKYVFDFVGRYATAPTRVLNNMLIAISTYALIFYLVSEFIPFVGQIATTIGDNPLNHQHDFWNAFYYSAITFFTIGYGDYFADGYLKPVAAMEGFSGVFLMSYFTVAFVRKILR